VCFYGLHFRNQVGITGKIDSRAVNRDDIANPSLVLLVKFFIGIVGGHCFDNCFSMVMVSPERMVRIFQESLAAQSAVAMTTVSGP